MQRLVGGKHVAALQHLGAALQIGDAARAPRAPSGCRRPVPRLQTRAPRSRHSGRPRPRRGRARPSRSGARRAMHAITAAEFLQEALVARPCPRKGMPVANSACLNCLARGDAQALVVEKGAVTLLGHEHLVGDRIEDDGRDELAFALQRDGDGEMRNAVQEVGGAVERIDDEAVGFVGPFDDARFLDQEGVAGPRLAAAPRPGCARCAGRRR